MQAPAERPADDPMPILGKTGRTLLVMCAALAVPYATPRLRSLRVVAAPWDAAALRDDPPDEPAQAASLPSAALVGEQALPESENTPTINNALPSERDATLPAIDPAVRATLRTVSIEDPGGHALDAFFARLERTDRKEPGAVTRVLHYGDSTIASDYVSGTMRRRLQARFGDAGHGFILIANPWEWYFHNDVFHASGGQWRASRLAGPIASDGMYGLGGVSFSSYGGDVAWFGTATRGDFGRSVSRYDVYYLEQPGGGTVDLSVHGQAVERVSTKGTAKVSRIHSLRVPDGESRLTLRASGGGQVRLFGVALERDVPGVVYDALGSHAAMAINWKRQAPAHWKDQIALRDPALIVFQYGTNESDLKPKLDLEGYERALGALVDELHDVCGGASILVVSPLDRAEYKRGRMSTRPVIPDLVSIQRRVALAHGAAFWSTYDAMGGEGSLARWVKTRPQLAGEDLTHPTPVGAEVIGDMLSDALVAAYDAWRRQPRR